MQAAVGDDGGVTVMDGGAGDAAVPDPFKAVHDELFGAGSKWTTTAS